MSFANQPSRLLISSDDLDYGSGSSFTVTLPESITGATKCDLIRAVIPNTLYPIPSYQANFYYYVLPTVGSQTQYTMTLDTSQYFDSVVNGSFPLLTALNTKGATMTPAITFSFNQSTSRISFTLTAGGGTVRACSKNVWNTPFALNTRLGFIDTQQTGFVTTETAEIMPNLVRSKVIYVLCNVVMNDSISTDGLRTALAKVPVNSVYGGLTQYIPPVLHWNRMVQGQSYQTITVQLIDDQYQDYPLQTNEFCELEIAFKYDNAVVSL
jgi:hypothetical protein